MMSHIYRNSLICCLVVLLPAFAFARSNKDADAVITMQNNQPCFSYPQDEEIQKRTYSFSYLSVTTIVVNRGGWLATINYNDKKGFLEPNSPKTCIKYGILSPGMKEEHTAKPLLSDTPYRVFIQMSAVPGFERKFASEFCISRNEKGEPVLVEADFDKTWHCLKPGETKKRGFWGWLFGK